MSILKTLREAFGGARISVAAIQERLFDLRMERERIESTVPHLDDLVAWLRRGLDAAAQNFESRLETYFCDENLRRQRGSFTLNTEPPHLVGLPIGTPASVSVHMPTRLNQPGDFADIAAVTYFLRPVIDAQLPALVAKRFPAAKQGMKAADRMRALAAIDAEVAKLEREQAEITDELVELRQDVASQAILTPRTFSDASGGVTVRERGSRQVLG